MKKPQAKPQPTLDDEIKTVQTALACYCEDCISSDKAEIARVERAFQHLVALAVYGTKNLVKEAQAFRKVMEAAKRQEDPARFLARLGINYPMTEDHWVCETLSHDWPVDMACP